MKQKSLLNYLGNFLIFFSLGLLLFIYYPFVNVYFFPTKIDPNLKAKGYYIQIPKISAQAPIILNVNPWKEAEYKNALKKGVAQAKNTALPGANGTSFIFAHSSGSPLEISRYNTVFFRLGELNVGDKIIIFINGKKLFYTVRDKKVVWPNDISFLKNITKTQLIIQTCTPIGTDFQRLLIFADPT